MGIIRFIQAHNRNKELKGMRRLKEQELDVLERRDLSRVRQEHRVGNQYPQPSTYDSQQRYCYSCGCAVNHDYQICPQCGKDFRDFKNQKSPIPNVGKKIGEYKEILQNKSNKNKPNNKDEDDPLKILKIRYAKGKITKEEFEQMKKDIEI